MPACLFTEEQHGWGINPDLHKHYAETDVRCLKRSWFETFRIRNGILEITNQQTQKRSSGLNFSRPSSPH
ncbi:hypothetical protein NQZ68_001401 [Dissostichus eleginoides]|nr:hypothetical protein NQZ68_001401 [Dissostichus eleginoides]